MAGHNAVPSSAVPASTIALLQERFKKLQRVREMREAEREVLQYRLRRESSETPPPPQSPQPKWLFPAGTMPASATVYAGGHRHHHHHHRGEVLDTSLSVGLCPRRSGGGGGGGGDQGLGLMTMSSETDVVDTSLHL